jgi:hypothetical protein
MPEEQHEPQQQMAEQQQGRKMLIAYNIIERAGRDKAIFSRVGCAFVNKDGSLNLHLDSMPFNGKVHIREERERPDWQPRRRSALLDAEA